MTPVETAPSPERTIIDAARAMRNAQKHFYAMRRGHARGANRRSDVNKALDFARHAEREFDNLLVEYDRPTPDPTLF